RIDTLAQGGNARAKFASHLTNNLDAYLSACQLGITLSSLALGWIGEPALAAALEPAFRFFGLGENLVHPFAFAIGFIIITMLHIVLGELAPKSLAIRKAESVTLWTAAPMVWFYRIMRPFILLLNGMANRLLRWIGIEPAGETSAHTEEEIRIPMKESHKSVDIYNTELTLVENLREFATTEYMACRNPRT